MLPLLQLVKNSDYDRYMLGLVQPASKRMGWMALCAFHAEIAKLPMSVSEPTIGLIRLAWWREAVAELQSGHLKKRHEITDALAQIPELPFAQMVQLLDAYETEIEAPIAASMQDLEKRILKTTHVLHQMLYGKAEEEESLRFGLVSFLKCIYPLARSGKPPFPRDTINSDNFGSAAYLATAKKVTQEIAERAKGVPSPMGYYLKQAKKIDYNLLQHDITPRALGYYVALMLR